MYHLDAVPHLTRYRHLRRSDGYPQCRSDFWDKSNVLRFTDFNQSLHIHWLFQVSATYLSRVS